MFIPYYTTRCFKIIPSIRIGVTFNLVWKLHIIIIHLSFRISFDIQIGTLSSKVIYLLDTKSFFIDCRKSAYSST